MKIVYCTWSILNMGGLERVLSVKANYLADLGHEITIITTCNGKGTPFHYFSPKIKVIDLNVEYHGSHLLSKVWNRYTHRKMLRSRLENVLMDIRPDITISLFQNEAPFIPSIKDGSIKIIENHSTKYYKYLRCTTFIDKLIARAKLFNEARLVRKYDTMVTLTNADKNDWSSNNIRVIPNPMTIPGKASANFKGTRVIAVGRFS